MTARMTPQDILAFWFSESAGKWFKKSAAFDALIRERFLGTYEKAVRGETAAWRETPPGRLAEIIVLDQFSRNLYRDSAKAFENDAHALALAQEAVRIGADRALTGVQRQFLYMPYMHSESREAHQRALRLFLSLPIWCWGSLFFELRHKAIIDRFGRYPHRNEVLRRASTPEERNFLKTHKGF